MASLQYVTLISYAIVIRSRICPLVPEAQAEVPNFEKLRLHYDEKYFKVALKKITSSDNQTVFNALMRVTNGIPFLSKLFPKTLQEMLNEGIARAEKTIFAESFSPFKRLHVFDAIKISDTLVEELVSFDLSHTVNAMAEIAELLKRQRFFMKTYLVGKEVMKINGVRIFIDWCELID
ncbi:unnamed protein product [Strongylus vulgaris]|uniref:Uncharacterized protein n=1 Tax=Strongylus vulgaris TaxID=40348 RepID=A0A3P7J483_STRVU|nr:unnamed protein product [Strongylus vulgaris]